MGGGSKAGPVLLVVAGISLSLMGFKTDPILRAGPRTVHGWIHDLAFVAFVLALLPSLLFLWRRCGRDPLWRDHARYTLATALASAAGLLLPNVAYYLFVIAVLAWIGATAMRLWRASGLRASSPRT